ncbi:MAG: hypothetical protein HC874_22170 [Richelia sp. SL_2_1]|nr:hypothetical protein [Richelia sp. SL_2_1]
MNKASQSRSLTSILGSASSSASTQFNVAFASLRQDIRLRPLRTGSNLMERSSSRGKSAT